MLRRFDAFPGMRPPHRSAHACGPAVLDELYPYGYSPVTGKPLVFVRSAREELRAFPAWARREAGHDPFSLQQGREPRD